MNRKTILAVVLFAVLVLSGCGKQKGEFDTSRAQGIIPYAENIIETAKETKTLRLYFMSGEGVTQKWGDSCLIVFPDGQTMLIDAGVSAYGERLCNNLMALGIDHLDYVVFSHCHDDHCYGILQGAVKRIVTVDNVWWNGIKNDAWGGSEDAIENFATGMNAKLTTLRKGDVIEIGGVKITVLSPSPEYIGQTVSTDLTNQVSLVMRFDYGSTSALFTGDIYMATELNLIQEYGSQPGGLLDADFMKLAHHGGSTSNSKDFLNAVSPKIAVATGNGATTDGTYSTIGKLGGRTYMDWIDGYVRVVLDGTDVTAMRSHERTSTYFDKFDEVLGIEY